MQEKSGSSRGRDRTLGITFTYFAGLFTIGLATSVLGPSLPTLAAQTGSTIGRISYLFTGFSLGYLLGSLLSGRIYDRVKGHPLLTVSLAAMALVLFAVPFIPDLWGLVALLFVLGLGGAVLDVGSNTLLIWMHGSKVGPFMNGLHFFFGLGALIAPVVVAQSLRVTGDINLAYWALAALFIPVAVIVLRLPSPAIRSTSSESESSSRADFLFVALIGFFYFLHVGSELGFGGWVYTYALQTGVGTETTAAYLNSAYWGSLTLGRLFGIWLSTKMLPRFMLLTDLAGCIIAGFIILFGQGVPGAVWAGTVLMGLSIASIFATGLNFAERNIHISGATTSWIFVGSSLGGMFFPWLIGQLFEARGPGMLPFVMIVSLATALGVLLMTFFRARRIAA
jgi:FHS family Na+ dependent glucose MFS transporter 1